ncbi:hypothetical protein FEM48_Zijuj10G0046600 [Ziziphus jujuba var. spinosa]|uniref:Protein SDA1 n=1 Tax=Ziziphus jujuba var. spinosa TaxID=714518 RepID=A0A978ULC6_ZIZJJ|nr:hypothetical protein FEM48_Zijuj10G0046600 [Ziziphus jujuba var. spinosa]
MTSHVNTGLSPEPLSASGRTSEKLSLPALQSKMKCDPEGYESELVLVYNQFKTSMELFEQQSALNFTSISGIGNDPTVAKELGERAMFLAHVTPFYPHHLADFPKQLADFLRSSAQSLPSGLRCHVAQALILLINRKSVDIGETLALFMELQTLGDRVIRKLAFSHVVHSIRKMNKKHKNEAKNRALQNILFAMLQQEDEAKAKRSLITLCELHRRKVWFDERTANAICTACFHSSSRIMIASLSFLLDYDKIEDDDDSDASSSDDESTPQSYQLALSREAVYKAHHKGTSSSKKKKKAKLQRAIRSMKKQQRLSSERSDSNYYSPLNHLKDPQGFVEKLFSRLQACNERFEVKMMILKVIARTVGLHRLILLSFYPYLQKYAQPHQREVTNLLAAAVQACHDMVPPDAVEPLFKQIVNQFVHDRSRPESIAVGLNVIREICLRMPLVCPSLLVKKDRGRLTDSKARPKAYGEANALSNVPGVELLDNDEEDGHDVDDATSSGSDDELDNDKMVASSDDEGIQESAYDSGSEDDDEIEEMVSEDDDDGHNSLDDDEDEDDDIDEEEEAESEDELEEDENEDEMKEEAIDNDNMDNECRVKESKCKKRKLSNFDKQVIAADTSLRALKRLAGTTLVTTSSDSPDGILSNEDFKRIKELKAKQEAKIALTQHGLLRKGSDAKSNAVKIPSSDQLSVKRVDPAKLEAHIRRKLSKEERLELVRKGREDRGKYQARAAVKQKKTGGLSNRQKEHKKAMPLAAKRSKVARTRMEKNKKHNRSGKQFRGKKAWK